MANVNAENRAYLFRLQTLIIDGGLLVLRHILDYKLQVQNISLRNCLGQERPAIVLLKGKKTITQVQYDLLYPAGGQPPSTADFDITLTICLLRSLKICGLNRKFNWNTTPQPGDTCIEADICRLKHHRNEIAHISKTTGIDQKEFGIKWTEIEQILMRLNSSLPNPYPNLQQTVDEFKTNYLDPEAEERIDKAIQEWLEMENRLELDVERIKTDIKEVAGRTAEHKTLIKHTQSRLTNTELQTSEHTDLIKKTQSRLTDTEERTSEHTDLIKKTQSRLTDTEKRTSEHTDLIKQTQSRLTDTEKLTAEHTDLITKAQRRVTALESHIPKAQKDETQDLREDLIRLYTSEHRTILLDPLFEEKDTPIVNFYVMPDFNIIETQNGKEVKSSIKSLPDVFKKDGELSREIYLTADAGYGKTAFSKYLALIWCQAHSPDSRYTAYFDEDHLNAMRQFELLFLVLLRDSSDDCSIDEMIFNQIIKETSNSDTMNMSSLQAVLHRERYLVILDGLDEWTHPEIKCGRPPKPFPHRNAREKCVIITTTRPWKLGVINLKTSQICKKIELAKLNSVSAKLLKERAISKIKGIDIRQARRLVKEFNAEVAKCSLGDLESVPLLLMYLIYLWCNNIPLGQSRCGLYTCITELLLSRTVKKYPHLKPTCEHSQIDFPLWLSSEHGNCKENFSILTALGRLAFHTLFCKTRENTLVFDSSVAEEFLRNSEVKFSIESGIITQSKVQVSALKQSSKISFAHKSVQEYFSALYMSCQSESDVQKIIQENCKSLQDILDMSAVFVFISGMNGEMMTTISRELMSVISEDTRTTANRDTTRYDYSSPLKIIQNMYISCIKENSDNNDLKLCLRDFFIGNECRERNYNTTLQRLAYQNKSNIRSVSIDNINLGSLHEIVHSFTLTDLNHLQKIYCSGDCEEADIIRLLSGTVKYAGVHPRRDNSCSMTSALCRKLQTLHQLEGIHMQFFKMSHAVLEEFLDYVTNRKSMKQIRLFTLICDHRYSCYGVNLDLSQHTELRTLGLGRIPLSQLSINVTSLEECVVNGLFQPGLASLCLSQLPTASKLHTLKCYNLEKPIDIETLLQTLPLLVHVKEVRFSDINLGGRSLRLSPQMINIEHVDLFDVTMPSSSYRDLVNHVEQLLHFVRVDVDKCNITPTTERKAVNQYVRKSVNFVVTLDSTNWFRFVKPAVETKTTD